jgi:hypothetical protein
MMENIHNKMYSLLIDTYVDDNKLKRDLFHGINAYGTPGAHTVIARKAAIGTN